MPNEPLEACCLQGVIMNIIFGIVIWNGFALYIPFSVLLPSEWQMCIPELHSEA